MNALNDEWLERRVSISFLERELGISYARSDEVIRCLEAEGIIRDVSEKWCNRRYVINPVAISDAN